MNVNRRMRNTATIVKLPVLIILEITINEF